MKKSNLSKSVEATMGAFQEKVKSLEEKPQIEDRLLALKAHIDKQVEIPLDYIRVEDNVRRLINVDSPKFSELVESIRHQGLLQNLVVELRKGAEVHELICIAGQRRLLAAREAGKSKAMCLIKEFTNQGDRIASGLAENLTREDLHCLDIAEGFNGLLANGWSEERIAEQFERNPRTIRRYRTIAEWPSEILEIIREHQDVFTTKLIFNELVARKFASPEEFKAFVLSKVRPAVAKATSRAKAPDKLRNLEKSLKSKWQTKVSIKGTEDAGKITINFASKDQLERLQKALMAETE